jgi:hypothetical protein
MATERPGGDLASFKEIKQGMQQRIVAIVDGIVAQNPKEETEKIRNVIAEKVNETFGSNEQGLFLLFATHYLETNFTLSAEAGLQKGPYVRKNIKV